MTRAVHWLQCQYPIFCFRGEHVLTKFLPMARSFPQTAVDQFWSLHLDVTGIIQALAHISLQRAVQLPALRVPKHHANRFLLEME